MSESSTQLESLYPFLHGGKKDPAREQAALLESVRQKCQHSLSVKERFFADNGQAVIDAAQAIATVYQNHGRMLSMGNGGSSCDASHFAVEFQHPITTGRPALPAINLVMDTAMISAVANDVGTQQVFVRQLEAHGRAEDGLIGFSTSGNSANLLAAFAKAKQRGLCTLALAGGDGGDMKSSGLVDHCLVVETDSIHRVQEVHVATYHILWDLVHTLLADSRGKLATPTKSSSSPNAAVAPQSPSPLGGGVGEEKKLRNHARELRNNPTDAEQKLWQHLRGKNLGSKFRRQHPIGRYITDFACLEHKLIIELDGSQHSEQQAYDDARSRFLQAEGFRVLRFWNNQVLQETEAVLESIVRVLEDGAL